jgi:hypothetical protein
VRITFPSGNVDFVPDVREKRQRIQSWTNLLPLMVAAGRYFPAQRGRRLFLAKQRFPGYSCNCMQKRNMYLKK